MLTLGYLATNSKGQTFVVVAMLSDPAAALSPHRRHTLIGQRLARVRALCTAVPAWYLFYLG